MIFTETIFSKYAKNKKRPSLLSFLLNQRLFPYRVSCLQQQLLTTLVQSDPHHSLHQGAVTSRLRGTSTRRIPPGKVPSSKHQRRSDCNAMICYEESGHYITRKWESLLTVVRTICWSVVELPILPCDSCNTLLNLLRQGISRDPDSIIIFTVHKLPHALSFFVFELFEGIFFIERLYRNPSFKISVIK